jgi:hypothetical protein
VVELLRHGAVLAVGQEGDVAPLDAGSAIEQYLPQLLKGRVGTHSRFLSPVAGNYFLHHRHSPAWIVKHCRHNSGSRLPVCVNTGGVLGLVSARNRGAGLQPMWQIRLST